MPKDVMGLTVDNSAGKRIFDTEYAMTIMLDTSCGVFTLQMDDDGFLQLTAKNGDLLIRPVVANQIQIEQEGDNG